MKVSNAIVVGVVCAFASGCAYLPTGHPSRNIQTPTESLFVNEGISGGSESDSQAGGLRIRKSDRGNMESYVVRGQRYFTMDSADGYSARGIASWYGPNFHGRTASNGEVYDMYRLTAAHKTLPLPTYAKVTHLENGRSVMVKINDRGPFSGDRIIDLSFAAALRLGMVKDGTANVEIQALSPEELMVMSGPDNNLGIDFYTAGADGSEISDSAEPILAEPMLADPMLVDPEMAELPELPVVSEASAQPEILRTVVPARPQPVSGDDVATEGLLVDVEDSAEDSISDQPVTDGVLVIVSESDVVDESVLPVVADATGVTAVPAAVQTASPQMVKIPSNVERGGYYVQAGVFADVADAEGVAIEVVLAAPGEEVHVKPLKDSHMYRITVGPIISPEHAGKVSKMLDDAGLENFTVRVK